MDWLLIAASQSDPSVVDQGLTVLWTLFKMAAGLGFVIFVHELGHFLVAKACGVKCEKFYIGFDIFNLRLLRFQWGETEYGIGALPLGGYVKMLGQDDDPRNYQKEVERSTAGNADADTERAKAIAEGKAAEALAAGKTVEKQDQKPTLDPRSYLAKSVPARMAIISAGVIMNVIFAVLMAAVAFKMGVKSPPAVVGVAAPGSPAWLAGWQPGDQIIQFGKSGAKSEHLRFLDLTKQVAFNGGKSNLEVLIRRADGKEEWHTITPALKDPKRPNAGRMLGVALPYTRTVTVLPEGAPIEGPPAEPALESEDEVVAINDKKLENDFQLPAELAWHPDESITLTVLRFPRDEKGAPTKQEPKRLEVKVAAVKMREVGLTMKMGPIAAVRPGSPAAEAGIQAGDVLETVDGEPAGDPLSLPQRLLPKTGEEIKVGVRRGGSNHEFSLKLGPPTTFEGPYAGGPISLDGLGIAYNVSNEIATVAEGSSAAESKLKAGQTVTSFQFVTATKQDEERLTLLGMKPGDVQKVDADGPSNWARAMMFFQEWPTGTRIKLTVATDGKWETKEVKTAESEDFFNASRNLRFMPLMTTQQAETWPLALQWGLGRTKNDLGEVLTILDRLRTRDVSPANLSGPFGILGVTYKVAERSIPDLLILLAYLGANLAVINMLPIPVLDGGHLVFLAYEGIRGKPADPEWQIRLSVIGLLFLLSVMVFATAMDFGLREFFLN